MSSLLDLQERYSESQTQVFYTKMLEDTYSNKFLVMMEDVRSFFVQHRRREVLRKLERKFIAKRKKEEMKEMF